MCQGSPCIRCRHGKGCEQRKETVTPLFLCLPEAMADFWKEDEPLPEEALLQDLAWADAVVAGPGLSKSRTAKELLVFTVQHTEVPLVLDADALNLIAEDAEILSGCRAEKF